MNERNRANELKLALDKTENNYLKLLNDYTKKQNSFTDEIKKQLVDLRKNYEGINDEVAIELKTIIDLIDHKKEEIAIEKLTKVIEFLLKEKYISEGKAKDSKSCPKLFKMLDDALALDWITKHEYSFSNLLRENRNLEAHELAVKLPSNWKYLSFLCGIEIIYKLKGIKS